MKNCPFNHNVDNEPWGKEYKDYYIDEKANTLAKDIFKNIEELFTLARGVGDPYEFKINACSSTIKESFKILLDSYESTYDSYVNNLDDDY